MIYFDNAATTFPKPESVYLELDKANRNAFNTGRGSYKCAREASILKDLVKNNLCKQNDIVILYFSNDKTILNSIDLYTKENTATNLTELLSLIEKYRNTETLFESIVKNVIN